MKFEKAPEDFINLNIEGFVKLEVGYIHNDEHSIGVSFNIPFGMYNISHKGVQIASSKEPRYVELIVGDIITANTAQKQADNLRDTIREVVGEMLSDSDVLDQADIATVSWVEENTVNKENYKDEIISTIENAEISISAEVTGVNTW